MSKKQWLVLLMLFLTYLLLGALIFYHIESRQERETLLQKRKEQNEFNEYLHSVIKRPSNEIFEKLTTYCGKTIGNLSENADEIKWDFYNSFYFAYTVVSTIGYGNLAPTGPMGRILTMIYALIGIPMNGILLSQLGEYFSRAFVKAHQKYKSYKHNKIDCPKKLTPLETGKAGLTAQILMYLCPGFVMFIFFPAFLFSHYEEWSYEESVYYAFITLTTIGFGDFVAGQDNSKGSGFFFVAYKIFLIAWISFGLGYIVMIMTFIARGMRSKKIVRIEQKLAMNLKHTQSKIWNEFNKEVNYLRRVFNELQLSKVRRVYVDKYDPDIPTLNFPRSNSFPNLRILSYGSLEPKVPLHPRRRANSEVVPRGSEVPRVVSETDLQRIDKQATFATHAMIQPAELLARLVNILGYIPPLDDDEDDTIDNQADYTDRQPMSNISTRRNSGWMIGAPNTEERSFFPKPRSRAVSEVRLEKPDFLQNGEWTWSGPAASRKIQEIMKARSKSEVGHPPLSGTKDSKGIFPSLNLSKSMLPKWVRQKFPKKNDETLTSSFSTNDINKMYAHEAPAEPSEGPSNLLEETSVADFLRALTALHVNCTFPDEYATRPRRKMGTAGLVSASKPASSLLSLFSLPANHPGSYASQSQQNTVHPRPSATGRRYSLMVSGEPDDRSHMYRSRSSTVGQGIKIRRFSLRPVATPIATPPQYSSFTSIADDRTSPPPYSDPYEVDSPRKPFVDKEKAPGVSTPIATSLGRFSLRPTQLELSVPPAAKPIPAISRWKAGLLQRQMSSKKNSRTRAFSLSDMQTTSGSTKPSSSISPLALDAAKPITLIQTGAVAANQKTVTILSPESQSTSRDSQYIPLISVSSDSTEIYSSTPDSDLDKNSMNLSQKEGQNSETDSVKSSDLTMPLISRDSSGQFSTDSLSPQYNRKRSTHVKTKSESDSSDLEKANDTHTIFKSLVDEKKRKTSSDEGELQSRGSSFIEDGSANLAARAAQMRYADDDDLISAENYSLFERRQEPATPSWIHSQEASTSQQPSNPSELIEIKIDKDGSNVDSDVSTETKAGELSSVQVEKP